MLLKKLLFSLGHKILKAVVAVEGGHEFREIIRVLESKRNRREGRTSEGIGDLIEIAPRLGVKTAAIGVEDADNRPQVTTKLDLLTDLDAKEAIHNAGSGDNFSRSPFEHSPCNDSNLRPQLQRSFLYASDSNVADPIRSNFPQIYNNNHFLGADELSLGGPGDMRQVSDNPGRFSVDDAHDLACCRLAHHGDVVIGTSGLQGLLDPIGHHQDGRKNKHYERDAKDRNACS